MYSQATVSTFGCEPCRWDRSSLKRSGAGSNGLCGNVRALGRCPWLGGNVRPLARCPHDGKGTSLGCAYALCPSRPVLTPQGIKRGLRGRSPKVSNGKLFTRLSSHIFISRTDSRGDGGGPRTYRTTTSALLTTPNSTDAVNSIRACSGRV